MPGVLLQHAMLSVNQLRQELAVIQLHTTSKPVMERAARLHHVQGEAVALGLVLEKSSLQTTLITTQIMQTLQHQSLSLRVQRLNLSLWILILKMQKTAYMTL